MTKDFAIVYYMTEWRADLALQLSASLTSLDLLGIGAQRVHRYLTLTEPVSEATKSFLDSRGVEVLIRDRFTQAQPFANKTLISVSQPHRVVMCCDLDIVFLGNPLPLFERAASSRRFLARPDFGNPLYWWPEFPAPIARFLQKKVGRAIWQRMRSRYRKLQGNEAVPYFNSGIFLCPGPLFSELMCHWWRACSSLLRARRRRYPYIFFFTFHFYDQLALSLALESSGIPFDVVGAEYNYMPTKDKQELCSSPIACHLVTDLRGWYDLTKEHSAPGNEDVYGRVREILRENNRFGAGSGHRYTD